MEGATRKPAIPAMFCQFLYIERLPGACAAIVGGTTVVAQAHMGRRQRGGGRGRLHE